MNKNFYPKTILVAIDFSRESFNALDTAIAIAQQKNASITMIHVLGDVKISIVSGHNVFKEPARYLYLAANENLNMLCKSLCSKFDMPVAYKVEAGGVCNTICDYAKKNNFDLIVIGTKGVFGFKRIFVGSTAYQVVRESPCPVLSVPATRLFTRFRKVIFPVRDAPCMLNKYKIVRPVLEAGESSLMITGLTKRNNALSFGRVSRTIEALREKLCSDEVQHSSRVHFCYSVSSTLLEISSEEKPDLIVIVAVIHPSLKRFFLEYYAKRMVCGANCAVLSVRPGMAIID